RGGLRGSRRRRLVGTANAWFTGELAYGRSEDIASVLGRESGRECRMVHLVLRQLPQPGHGQFLAIGGCHLGRSQAGNGLRSPSYGRRGGYWVWNRAPYAGHGPGSRPCSWIRHLAKHVGGGEETGIAECYFS